MRFLKTKIARAKAFAEQNPQVYQKKFKSRQNSIDSDSLSSGQKESKKRMRLPGIAVTPEDVRSTKNISKNFGRAICSFAVSHLALPYLLPLLEESNVQLDGFITYVNGLKSYIDGLHKFREILMAQDGDSAEIISYKNLFKQMGEVFIKCFSVNWIFNSKLLHKIPHLKFRGKMLRRIRNPELFTYIKKNKGRKRSG